MRLFFLICATAIFLSNPVSAQELPYYEIPEYPDTYSGQNVAARVIDGLGYRYFWATEGLRNEDLVFKPNDDARSTAETLDHIYGLALTIVNACKNQPNIRPQEEEEMTFAEKRKRTLNIIKEASDLLKAGADLENSNVIFQRGDRVSSTYPFWNMLNGPIADAIWHVGQVVSFRRSSGNPLSPKPSFLRGKVRG